MRYKSLLSIFYLCMLLCIFMTGSHTVWAQITPPPIEIDVVGTCIPSGGGGGGGGGTPPSTKFFVNYSQQPDSVYWLFEQDLLTQDSLYSRHLQPIHTFTDAGSYGVVLHAVYGQDTVIYDPFTVTIETNDSQLQIKEDGKDEPVQEVVLCDVPKTLTASLSEEGGGGGAGSGGGAGGVGGAGGGGGGTVVTWYRPQSADEAVTVSEEIEVGLEKDENGKYKDVGTYYVVYDDGNCPIYQTFRVVVYEETDQNSSRWYFGNNAGIDFMSNTAITGNSTSPEGNAMVGDYNADVLFHTNGENLWYGNDLQQPGTGNNMGGDVNVAQNSLFVGFPADETLYYLFTINDNRELSFSTLDLKSSPPVPGTAISELGDNVGQPIKNILLHSPVAEKLTSTSRTGGGVWVIAHELGSNTFLSYPVTPEGIGAPVESSVGSNMANTNAEATGYMQVSEDGTVLASTVNNPTQIELFKFDAENGELSDPIQLPVEESGTLYGLGFAGDRLYATVSNPNGPSYLYQYTVDSTLDLPTILASKVTWTIEDEELGAVQLGPDGQIYIARNGKPQLFRIPNDSLSSDFPLAENFFDLAEGTTSTMGLPNFGANAGASVPEPGVTAMGACLGDSILVSGMQRYSNDEMLIFELLNESGQVLKSNPEQATGNGATSGFSADDYGNQPGTYSVRLTIENECGTHVVPELATATVSAIPEARLATDQSLELCENQSVTFIGEALIDGELADPSTLSFVWFDAISNVVVGTDPELTVEEAGAWRFFVANGAGCTSDTLNVEAIDLRPQASLGDDIGLCVGSQPTQQLSVTIAPPDRLSDFDYRWRVSENGGETFQDLSATESTLSLDGFNTDIPGTYKYLVEVTHKNPALGNCFKADTLTVTVAPIPQVRIVASNNNCDGTAVLTAEVEGAVGEITYNWEGPAGSISSTSPRISVTTSGTYSVSIVDAATDCNVPSANIDVDLQHPLGDISIEVIAGCATEGMVAPNMLQLQTSYSGGDLTIRWYNLDRPSEEIPNTRNEKEIMVTENGTYRAVAEITNTNCSIRTASAEEEVMGTIIPQNQLQSTYIVCPSIPEMSSDTISVSGFSRYEWKNVATGQVVDRDSVFIVNQEGQFELRVNGCSDPARFTVRYDCTPVLWVPNAIKVDGTNNTFRILNESMLENIRDFQILIINRWGEVIYQSNDPFFEWRGTDRQNKAVMVNTYAYVITYRNEFGENQDIRKQRGGITVLR